MSRSLPFPWQRALLLLAIGGGCGTTGDVDRDPRFVPTSGAGPFRRLSDESLENPPPFVLTDGVADLDEPSLVADGLRLALWVTARRGGTARIEHADSDDLKASFTVPETALVADQAWELGSVSGPSVIAGSPWLLFYAAGGAIGFATADDGHGWRKGPGPTLVADRADEGLVLGAPGAIRLGGKVRVYYPANGALWAAEAPYADLASGRAPVWTRLDGNPTTPEREPMVASATYATAIGRACAFTGTTPAGRARHDLYFSATADPNPTIGFAASYSGDRFTVAAGPILIAPAVRAPAMVPYGAGALLLFVQRGQRDGIAAATSP
ncbi:MAG: hypothetical protein EXR72_19130 [Myxococcales bacterium]|nr:hypothetical protein [Myxococcales bacterium]